MRRIVQSSWFRLFDLVLVLLCGAIWYLWPQVGAWPLLIAVFPWVSRLAVGRFPFRRTVFDLALALFLLTAGIGVWAAYQPEPAWAKFWIIVAAVLLFYAAANLSIESYWIFAGLLGLIGVSIGIYFFLSHDWQAQPSNLGVLQSIGLKWMLARPALDLPAINQNMAGGILAMCLPFPVALVLRAWRARKLALTIYAITTSFFVLVGLLLTSSRGAWLASILGFGVWFLWGLSGRVAQRTQKHRRKVFLLLLLLFLGLPVFALFLSYGGEAVGVIEVLVGASTAGSRTSLYRDTIHLLDDFTYMGGGLGGFPGLYSQYIKILPFYYFGYSHNFYLDVALEQGVLGIISLSILFLGSFWLVINSLRNTSTRDDAYLLNWAILVSLLVVILHGFVDDPLYGEKGTPFLFLLSGLSIAADRSNRAGIANKAISLWSWKRWSSLSFGWKIGLQGSTIIVVAMVAFFGLKKSILSEWYANLGAVHMARTELNSFPTRRWEDNTDISAFHPAQQWFVRSLELDPDNETSHYRLGLIAMRAHDFPGAQAHLETAFASDPDHPGLRKSLAYTYLWSGQLAASAQLLEEIPEVDHELRVYIGWWRNLDRPDLSERATSAEVLLRMISILKLENIKE